MTVPYLTLNSIYYQTEMVKPASLGCLKTEQYGGKHAINCNVCSDSAGISSNAQ